MIFSLVVVALMLGGGTTWLVLTRPVAGDPGRHDRLSRAGLVACMAVVTAAIAVVAATSL